MKKVAMLFLCVVVLLIGVPSFAANVDTYGIGAKATALGGAFAAYADDPYAAYYNPAGLVQIHQKEASIGTMVIDPYLKVKGFKVKNSPLATSYGALTGANNPMGPEDANDESPLLIVPHVGFAMPLNDKISIGIAAYVPFGLHLKWDDTYDINKNPLSFDAYESWYQRIVVTPTIAYKINDKLAVGIGISLGRGDAGTYKNIVRPLSATTVLHMRGEIELTDTFNYSVNVGVMYKPLENLILGITYRSMAQAHFDGTWKNKGISSTDRQNISNLGLYKSDVSMDDVSYPRQVQVGIRYMPTKKLSLEADLVWTQWSMIDKQTLEVKNPNFQQYLLGGETESITPRDWEDTRQVKLGIEWKATKILTLRCGYFYDPTPIPDHTFDNVWPDADKKTYSVGMGLNLGKWTVDTVLQYTTTEKDREIGGESVSLNDAYGSGSSVSLRAQGQIWGAGITISYRF